MKIRHSIIALLVAGFACGLQAQDGKPAATKPKLASGLMMKQGDKLIFAPCRDRSYATVDDISPAGMLSAAQGGAAEGIESSMLKLRGTQIRQALQDLCRSALGPMAAFSADDLPAGMLAIPPEGARAAPVYFNHRKLSIYGGSNEIQRNIISKMILGL